MTQQINLFDPSLRRARDPLAAQPVAAAAAICLALIAVLATWTHWRAHQREAEVAALQPQVEQAQQQLAALGRDAGAVKRSAALEAELAEAGALVTSREEVLRVLAAGTAQYGSGYSEYLRALSRQTVPELWLTGFSFADGAGELVLRGRTLDPAQVPTLIKRLGNEKALQGRQIAEVSLRDSSVAVEGASAGASRPAAGTPHRYTEFILSSGKNAAGEAAGGRP